MKVSALDALLLLFLINLVLQPPTEPDFGWHLRAGIDLIDHGWRMPETDPYSHTMPDWRWIEHAWLSDGILGVLSTSLGAFGLLAIIVLFGIVTGGAFLLAASTSQASWTARLLASVAALWAALPFLGARIQMITLLGVAVLLWLWRRAAAQPAVLWLVPPLFLLWANLHGGFTAGLFTLGLMLIVATGLHLSSRTGWDEPLPSRRLLTRWAIAVSAAAAVTVLNPYGLDLHREIVSSLTDRYMLETLHEWQPVTLAEPAGRAYALYAGLLLMTAAIWYRRREPVRWVLILVFFGLSLRHWRNVPLFLLLSVPVAADTIDAAGASIVTRLRSARIRRAAAFAVTVAAAMLAVSLGAEHLAHVMRSALAPTAYFQRAGYPMGAVQWIRAHGPPGHRMLNDYGWGGFLTWWLPEEKIFIDGRMPAWRIGERRVFSDYMALTNNSPPALAVLDKYAVDWALLPADAELCSTLARQPAWRELYRDEVAAIYRRIEAIAPGA